MKIFIASDIHGSAYWMRRIARAIEEESPDRVVLLGDLLYHGPRNDLPRDYAPKEVAPILNDLATAGNLVAVRGNCDAEVDQMVLDFPCMGDFAEVVDEAGRTLLCTHGHVFGAGFHNSVDNLPKLTPDSAVLFGHTHVKVSEPVPARPEIWAFNPGSASIPKDGSHSYGVYTSGLPVSQAFCHVMLEEE